MVPSVEVSYRGRKLQIKALVVAGDWQIWFCEHGRRVYLHSVLPHERRQELQHALHQARREAESDTIVVPVVRTWPALHASTVGDTAPND